jgi:N-acetyl-anhydromuramyl-L-alanine amidase AmpD
LDQHDKDGHHIAVATDWASEPAQSVLQRSARLVAELCRAWQIPVVRLGPADLLKSERGICGHLDATRAYPGSGTHVDPGPRWPWDQYLELIQGLCT